MYLERFVQQNDGTLEANFAYNMSELERAKLITKLHNLCKGGDWFGHWDIRFGILTVTQEFFTYLCLTDELSSD